MLLRAQCLRSQLPSRSPKPLARNNSALREIGVLEEPARLADYDSKLQIDGLKIGVDPLAAGCLQGAEQPIAPRVISLTFGHIA